MICRLFFVLTCVASAAYAQDAREIMERYLKNVSGGDVRNWDRILTIYSEDIAYYSQNDFEGKTNLVNPDKPSYHKTYIDVAGDQMKDELYSDSSFVNQTSTFYFLKNKTIILLERMKPIVKEPFEKEPFYHRHFPVYVSNLLEHSKAVELLGIKEMDLNKSVYEIKVRAKGRDYFFYINVNTYLLEYHNIRPDSDRSFLVKLDEYKKVGDFLIPTFEASTKDNVTFFWSRRLKTEFNKPIDPAVFRYQE